MAQLSTARKLSILARVAFNSAGRNRTVGAAMSAARITGNHVGRVVHLLWLEVTGFVFLILGLVAGLAGVRELHKYQAGQATVSRIALAGVVAFMFVWFGISSFWRVKRKKN
jgi:hypothetical protein